MAWLTKLKQTSPSPTRMKALSIFQKIRSVTATLAVAAAILAGTFVIDSEMAKDANARKKRQKEERRVR